MIDSLNKMIFFYLHNWIDNFKIDLNVDIKIINHYGNRSTCQFCIEMQKIIILMLTFLAILLHYIHNIHLCFLIIITSIIYNLPRIISNSIYFRVRTWKSQLLWIPKLSIWMINRLKKMTSEWFNFIHTRSHFFIHFFLLAVQG